jgi:prepilin-type N-terminal cleavage/methylation domain-containing protein
MTGHRLLRLRRLLAPEAGYTLTELLTVLAIMSIVLGGLAVMFQTGVRAEVRANRNLQAQQNARAALDRMRRELHCADEITAANGTPVASITVSLPPGCPGSDTTVTYTTSSVGTSRYELTRAGDSGTPVGVADFLTTNTVFTYYAPASGTLARLHVDFLVNIAPADATTLWRLQDDIVLRNTSRL